MPNQEQLGTDHWAAPRFPGRESEPTKAPARLRPPATQRRIGHTQVPQQPPESRSSHIATSRLLQDIGPSRSRATCVASLTLDLAIIPADSPAIRSSCHLLPVHPYVPLPTCDALRGPSRCIHDPLAQSSSSSKLHQVFHLGLLRECCKSVVGIAGDVFDPPSILIFIRRRNPPAISTKVHLGNSIPDSIRPGLYFLDHRNVP